MPWLLPILLAATTTGAPKDVPLEARTPAHVVLLSSLQRRVRGVDAYVQSLLAEGLQRSATFERLVTRINHTDLIVYVEVVMGLRAETQGRLLFVPVVGPQRYVRVQIRKDATRREAIALIGHELQHALEIAEAPAVRSEQDMEALYRRIGESSGFAHSYDTQAARDAGRLVRIEIAG